MNAMVNDVKDFLVSLNDGSKSTGIPVHVAMVEFAFGATVAHPLVLLNDTTLDSLRDAIPNVPVGGTCIGCGILRGVEVGGISIQIELMINDRIMRSKTLLYQFLY